MPSIISRQELPTGYQIDTVQTNTHSVPTPSEPAYASNPYLKCPFPGLSTPDSLRQFYKPGVTLQRLMPVTSTI